MRKTSLFIVISLLLGLYGCGNKMIETEVFCSEKTVENDSVTFSAKICIELAVKGKKSVVDAINKTLVKSILDVDFDGTPTNAIDKHIANTFNDYDAALEESHESAFLRQNFENINGIVTFLNENYMCYKYDLESYSGGAHDLTETLYFVFDLKTGKKLTEKEVFKSGCQEKLSEILTEILSDTELYPDNDTYNLEELKLNGNFLFEPDTLIYTFNRYEIAPYSSGKIDIKIPYEKVKEIIKINLNNLVK